MLCCCGSKTAAGRPHHLVHVTQAIAAEFAQDEANHVTWLQQNLGVAAIPMPQVRILRSASSSPVTRFV